MLQEQKSLLNSQSENDINSAGDPGSMPTITVDSNELQSFLTKNLRMTDGTKTGIQVQVTANFVIDANGKVRDLEITQMAETVFKTAI